MRWSVPIGDRTNPTRGKMRLAAAALFAGLLLCLCVGVATPQSHADPAVERENSPLLFLGDKDYPPLSYLDGNRAEGMDVDVARALGATLKREIRVELLEWHIAQEKMQKGEADGRLLC